MLSENRASKADIRQKLWESLNAFSENLQNVFTIVAIKYLFLCKLNFPTLLY